jgi:thiamine monophosphate kinase
MTQTALTGERKAAPKTLVQQESDFTAEGAPPPGCTAATTLPATGEAKVWPVLAPELVTVVAHPAPSTD